MIKRIILFTLFIIIISSITFAAKEKDKQNANAENKQNKQKQKVDVRNKNYILTLDKCLSLVLNKSDEYKSYLYKLKAKAEKINEAKANLYYPNISMGLRYAYQGVEPEALISPAPHKFTTSFDINKVVYNFGRFGALVSIAEKDYALSNLDRISARSKIISDIQSAFYGVLLAQHNVSIIKDANELLHKSLKLQRRNYLSGRLGKSNYIRIRVLYETDKINLTKAKNELIKSINRLFVLVKIKPIHKIEDMNYTIEGNFDIEKRFLQYDALTSDINNAVSNASKKRIEARRLVLRRDILKLNETVASAAYKPALSLFASVNMDYAQQTAFVSSGAGMPSIGLSDDYKLSTNYILGASISIPLSELILPNSKSRSLEKSIEYERKGINKNIQDILSKIESEVIQKYLYFSETKNNLSILKRIVSLSRENFLISRRAYNASAMDYLDFLDAYVQYKKSRFSYYNGLYSYNMAYLNLLIASGVYF